MIVRTQTTTNVEPKWAAVIIRNLTDLDTAPEEDSGLLRRIMISKRHQLWRAKHPHDGHVQVRIIVWFPEANRCHVLIGGDKEGIEEQWYQSAVARAEGIVEQIKRQEKTQRDKEEGK